MERCLFISISEVSMRSRRASFGRRSRIALAWAVGLFVVNQAVTGWILDYAKPLVRFPTAKAVLAVARQEPKPPAFAFLGSSRTGASIYYDELEHALAEPGKPAPRA